LSYLYFLDLCHNNFSGILPESLSEISYLQKLDISFNNFKSVSVPTVLSKLPALVEISLAGCDIKGSIPDWLSIAPGNLSLLDLSSNNLTGPIPPWLGSMTDLFSLN
jgi:Leucine-rich repeat (LRR) protein